MKKAYPLVILFACFCIVVRSADLRGDTISIGQYTLRTTFTDFVGKVMKGDATIGVTAKMNGVQGIHLDLLSLTVDSVKFNGTTRPFQYSSPLINIIFPSLLNTGDSATLRIYYHGVPHQSFTDVGGFYWTTAGMQSAYNIGVSLNSDPHNFGKVWFPCFDNFNVRSYYEIYCTTKNSMKAYCSGTLIDSTFAGANTIWHYKLRNNIPSYLASVSIAAYVSLKDTVQGANGVIPVQIQAYASDTAATRAKFFHLHNIFHNLENHWGPYRWEKVGYSLVPFLGGAMEHATNISFSEYFVTLPQLSVQCEQKIAHELSHHWFGDLVTCQDASQMWLNEGWANYNEIMFFENIYSPDSAKKVLRDLHLNTVQKGHVNDKGYWPVSGVPTTATYGTTVYQKGCDAIHTLRYYMGDQQFFSCVQGYLNTYEFDNGSTIKLRDYLSQCSGIDLTNFFNNWVLSPGFTHFSIERTEVEQQGSNYMVRIRIRQRLSHAPNYFQGVPVKVSYFKSDMTRTTETVVIYGECSQHTTTLGYEPAYVAVDFDEDLQDAISDEWQVLKDTVTYTFSDALMQIKVNNIKDSALVRIEHNWLPADPMFNPIEGLHLNNHRYWTIGGVFDSTFNAQATFSYNGKVTSYFDSSFISNREDSLVVMYRADQDTDWVIAPSFKIDTGQYATDTLGSITIYNLKKGEYALGIYDSRYPSETNTRVKCILQAGVDEISKPDFTVFPNPTTGNLTVNLENYSFDNLCIYDLPGRKLMEQKITADQNPVQLSLANFAPGTYLISLNGKNGFSSTKKFVKE